MIRFYDVENTANMAQATLKRSTGVNGSKTITGEIIAGNAVINGIGRGWSLVFEDEPYIITYTKFNDQTNSVEFDAIQKFFWDFAKSGFYQEWNGSHTFTDYLDALFENTGYEYILEANVAAFEKENWGMKNRLALFNDVISQAGVEFELIGKRVKITKSIGSDLSTIVRKGFNLSDMVKESSITDFVTYGKGFGAFNDSNDQSKGRLEVEYRSPLADIYGVLEADPLVDERYTIADSLLAAVKSEVDNSVAISIDLKIYDLPDADFTYQVPQAGDWIMAIDEAIGFSRRIRIINVDEEFDVNGQRIDYTATCGDLPIAVQQELSQSGQAHKIEQLTNDVDAVAISANGKNSNYYGSAEPSQPREGDLWYKKNGDDTELYVWANGRWEIVVSKNTSNIIDQKVDSKMEQLNADMSTANSNLQAAQQDVADLQVKLKDNDDAQAQLSKDLAANSNLITQNKADVDAALDTVNDTLSQAKSDAAQAFKNADDAVANTKQVIADVNSIKTTMTGANGYTTRLQTLEGFQQTATNSISGLQSAQTQLADTLVTTVGTTNLIMNSEAASDLSYWTDTNKSGWYRTSLAASMYNKTANSFGISREGLTAKTYAFLYSEMVPVSPGTPITAGAKMLIVNNIAMPNDFDYAGIGVRFYDKNKAEIADGVKTKNATGASLGEPWFQMKIENFVAPDTAAYVSLYFQSAGNGHIFFAQPQLSKSTTLPIYTPGSLDAAQLTIMQGLIDARVTVDGKIAAALSLSSDGGGTVTIRGASLYVTADSHFDDASIQSAAIASLDAKKITSGSISADRLATTKLNADNITSGSIAAERLAATKISATNIVGGTFDAGTMTVKRLSADMIATGTLDVSKLTAVKNFSASNIIGGTLDASTMTVKKLSASSITGGTINGANVNVIGLNASAITTGTISGANLAINLNTGMVTFQSGRIHSTTNNIDINVDKGYMSVADSTSRVLLKGGQLQFIQPQLFDLQTTPYLSISNAGVGSNWAGATIIGRDSIMLANSANVGDIMTWQLGQNTFSGLISGKNSNGNWEPTILGGADRGVVIVGGAVGWGPAGNSPYIRVGSSIDGTSAGNRIYVNAEYLYVPSIYKHTMSGSANVIVASDGALVRTSSATKYKSNIERFRNTDMGETLLTLPQAHWYNKQDMQRYADDPQHYSMPELDYGMIAEDLAAAGLEDLVVRGDDGQLEDIRYDRMTPALLPLLAQMKQEIEELKGEKSE